MRTLVVNALRMAGARTAIGRHVEHLALAWSRQAVPFDQILLMSPAPLDLPALDLATPVEVRVFGGRLPRLAWEQGALPRAARGASVLYSIYNCPLRYRGRIVLGNHGIYEALPDTFSWWTRLRTTPLNRRSARRADRVIANSENTRRDVVRYFGVDAAKVEVVYPAPAELFYETHDGSRVRRAAAEVTGSDAPYVLFVGKLSKRRHVPNLIAAFARVRTELGLPHRLLIVGPNTTGVPVAELAARHGVAGAVVHREHLDHPQLALLYAGAAVFALPTTYEGLSRTMLEAMASGAPVLTVEHPVLAEGGGDAVLAAPTPGVDDLAAALRELLTKPALRDRYRALGRRRAAQFSFARCAEETMAVLDKVALARDA